MHELALLEHLLSVVDEEAARRGARAVTAVRLSVGAMSGIDPQALRFGFDAAARGTRAEQASLELEIIAVVVHCPDCNCDFTPYDVVYLCPGCGAICQHTQSGDQLILTSLDLLYDEPARS